MSYSLKECFQRLQHIFQKLTRKANANNGFHEECQLNSLQVLNFQMNAYYSDFIVCKVFVLKEGFGFVFKVIIAS